MARPKGRGSIYISGRVRDVEFVQRKIDSGLSKTDICRQAIAVWRSIEEGGSFPKNLSVDPVPKQMIQPKPVNEPKAFDTPASEIKNLNQQTVLSPEKLSTVLGALNRIG